MKRINLKKGRHFTIIVIILTVLIFGSVKLDYLNVQAESKEQGDEDKLLEIIQGDFVHYFVQGSERFTFQLDVKEPETDVQYNWQILVPPMHGGAIVIGAGKSTDVSYMPAENFFGEDNFLVEVNTATGNRSKINVAVTVASLEAQPARENLQKPDGGEIALSPSIEPEQKYLGDMAPERDRMDKPGVWKPNRYEDLDPRQDELDALRDKHNQTQPDEINRSSDSEPEIPQQSKTGPIPPAEVIERDSEKPPELTETTRSEVFLSVPNYFWRHGCGPTALGMIIGYYDSMGFDDLIPGDASTQTSSVNQMIASGGDSSSPNPPGSEEHYEDYASPEDSSTLLDDDYITAGRSPHSDNSLADYMDTSKSTRGNYYGWSFSSDVGPAYLDYVNQQNSSYMTSYQYYSASSNSLTESVLLNEIDAGRPLVFLVDSDGNGGTDHFVPVIGYRYNPDLQYAVWDTWYTPVRWENFAPMASGTPWGIWGGWSFRIDENCTDPYFQVYPEWDEIYGYDWTPSTSVTLSIDSTVVAIQDTSEYGDVYFWLDGFDLLSGQVVEMTDGTYTRTHTVTSLTITDIDEAADSVSGTAEPGSDVYVEGWDDSDWHILTATADGSGDWIAAFTTLDVAPGARGYAYQLDDEGNSTNIYWYVPDPYLNIYPMGDYIYGYEWTPGVTVSATIDSVYKGRGVPNQDGRVYIDLTDDLVPGQLVELTDGIYTRSHIVQNLFVTNIDQSGDFVQGTADPLSELRTYACDDYGCEWVYPQADESGNWTSNYSGLVDIDTESYGWAYKYDNKGNSTRVHWYITDPSFIVYPDYGEIYGSQWPPETNVMLTIGSQSWTREADGYNGSVYFYPDIELSPGLTVQMTDGATTRTHTIIDLAVTNFDADADTLSGTADPGELTVYTCDSYDCYYRYPVADGNGNWTADFSGLTDIVPGSYGWMYQLDADGDETRMYWSLPNPRIEVHPNADTIYGYAWTPNTLVSLSIGGISVETQESSSSGHVYFELETHELLPGQVVEMTDDTYTKTHTIINLAVTAYDETQESLSGTANPGELQIYAYNENYEILYPVADSGGTWSVQLTSVDVAPGVHADIYQYDEDGDYTVIYWLIPDPLIVALLDNNLIVSFNWPANTEITMTITNTRETWVETTSESGYIHFNLDPFILQRGDTIDMTAGTYNQTHTVKNININEINNTADLVSGTAEPESELIVCAYDYTNNYYYDSECLTINADITGNWEANFSGLIDIRPGVDGSVRQYDDNENYTYIYWFASYDNQLYLPLILR